MFNYFKTQIFSDPCDMTTEYMRKHNQMKQYLYLERLKELEDPSHPIFVDTVKDKKNL
jgi:hypothetical protein